PVGALMLHFKKEQLLCALLPRRLTGEIVWAEWGPVPPPMRRGPARLLYALAARRARRIMAISEGTRRTIIHARALALTLAAYRDDRERCLSEGRTARAATLESHAPERTLRAVERAFGLDS